ncbi:MAG: LysR family transcriptional regulator [Pseudomonadota bacterium]
MNSDLLKTFVAIADCANLTTAAGRLNRTQSAISVQLRKLEADLGVSLFVRGAKGMRLSEHGERLLPKARTVLREVREAERLFSDALEGQIRIGLPDDFENGRLERILAEFATLHPGVEVNALSGCTSGFPDAIKAGQLDIAVCSGPKPLGRDLLAPEDVVWAAGRSAQIGPETLVPLAVLDRTCWWQPLANDALDATGREYKIAFRCSTFAGICAAIRAGLAVGIVPESALGEGMRRLSRADGFPRLAPLHRSILVNERAPAALTGSLKRAIQLNAG